MFADDTTLAASGELVLDAEVAINHDLANIKQWLSANKLSLNLVKTEYLLIGSRHNINNLFHAPKVHVGDIPIKRVKETKALGDIILEQDACTGVHSACRREEYGDNLDICVLRRLRLRQGQMQGFLGLKVGGGGLNLQIWDLNRAHETERTVFPKLQVL